MASCWQVFFAGSTLMPHELNGDTVAQTPALHVDVQDLPALITHNELAAFLVVSRKQLDRMINARSVVMPIKVAERNRWRRSDILNWLDGQSASSAS